MWPVVNALIVVALCALNFLLGYVVGKPLRPTHRSFATPNLEHTRAMLEKERFQNEELSSSLFQMGLEISSLRSQLQKNSKPSRSKPSPGLQRPSMTKDTSSSKSLQGENVNSSSAFNNLAMDQWGTTPSLGEN